jgi:hypothetical protein
MIDIRLRVVAFACLSGVFARRKTGGLKQIV